ncbi:uncharacterized protein LOC108906633 [Anoplophora glabripennis]|uniref:uncharacterized protein LOC108906633 n=1 Tax=Anoplophora glabripennis TaxID=217634 RepID=UPI00087423A0|nr:uncharacterized protein LOC108906633 [Anoplophora glabripennis]
MIDRFSRWPEAVPLCDQEAATVARALFDHWIARFGTPVRITTDQGRQFESYLFKHLNCLLGATHLRTTAYHPAANGLVERFHRQLKASIMCHGGTRWTETLSTVLMGIRSAWKEDIQGTAAELVYDQSLRLPGEFLAPQHLDQAAKDAAEFVKSLRLLMRDLRPSDGSRHNNQKIFVFKDLATTDQVFVCRHSAKRILQQPYDGPYKVLKRNEKTFVVHINGRDTTVSIDRLKPAYIASEETTNPGGLRNIQEDNVIRNVRTTRAGRRVRFPDRLQGGFN